ncbi:MAG: hypothetical protein QOG15_2803 [Solirubrobacteraceae bacterium]|jgi:hypothetical protein|nr:hypothetical protein [Solirubrobacteraceae bacterium]
MIRDQVKTHLAARSGTWLASFAELVVSAAESGVPVGPLQTHVSRLRGPGADGEVHDDGEREALIDALVGRWESVTPESDEPML